MIEYPQRSKFRDRNFISEVYRKAFHVGLGIFLILAYVYLGKYYSILIYSILLVLAIASDIIRLRIYIQYPLKRIAETISRSYERTFLGAHTYFLAGILLAALFFDETSFITAAFVVTIIDPIISITGLSLDRIKHPYNKEKSIIGSLIGASIAFIVFFEYMPVVKALIISIAIYIIDSVPLSISDNIIFPLVIGLLAYLL
ncbi:MAG TPA: hypothetical protein VKU94_02800 [Geobacterales bacterium]|nr:hypothetical protein [Geobacterales bacterium]